MKKINTAFLLLPLIVMALLFSACPSPTGLSDNTPEKVYVVVGGAGNKDR